MLYGGAIKTEYSVLKLFSMPKRMKRSRRRGRGNNVSPQTIWNRLSLPLTSERKTFTVRLTTGPFDQTATAGGVLSGTFPVDPSITSFTEQKSVTTLYSEMRVKAARLTIVPVQGNTQARPIFFASLIGGLSGAPTGYAQVNDNANCKIVPFGPNFFTTGRPITITAAWNVLNYQEWGTVSTDSAGAPGGFYWYGDGFTASQKVCQLILDVIFECRNRV